MHGNVSEWSLDWRSILSGGITDPKGPSSGDTRVRRGGDWDSPANKCSSFRRDNNSPNFGNDKFGFRLCMNPEGSVGASAQGSAAPAASGNQSNALYCVIDLSAGPNAGKYPVSYLNAEPKGGFNTDEYKTTKLVLRRIEPGSFKRTSRNLSVTLTKPYYMGIFEMTQKQYELVSGEFPGKDPRVKGASFPAWISWDAIRGDAQVHDWPTVKTVDADSFVGRIQARTGLVLDLPTEEQWEYACRAGTTSNFNNGGDSEEDLKKLGNYKGNRVPGMPYLRIVGSFLPNAWGLYDMHGNKQEWCLNPHDTKSGTRQRVCRGGSATVEASFCTSSKRAACDTSTTQGVRLCMNLK